MTRKQLHKLWQKENYFLRHGYYPSDEELKRIKEENKGRGKLIYGQNTVSR